jgi:vacuolar-type H+-ATPase subunit I/STV1
MFEKCIKCNRIGESCVPNLMLLPFADLIQWCAKRQKHLEWTNQILADKSKVPIGTINRIKAGEYLDCKYSTIKNILIALIGGTSDEFSCTEQVERELRQVEQLERQAANLSATQTENEQLKEKLQKIDEQHRNDIRAIKSEYQEQIDFLKEELKAWRSLHSSK